MRSQPVLCFVFVAAFIFLSTGCNQKAATNNDVALLSDSVVVGVSKGMPFRGVAISEVPIISPTTVFDTSGMIWIPGGIFKMGSNEYFDAQPIHEVELDGFWMDEHEVTNAQFALFVEATGYQTVAERVLNPADYPNVPLDMLVPGSAVFIPPSNESESNQWWKYVAGANWRHPEGPTSNIDGKENYPVVQVCYEDASAYAKWAGKRLPTEAEWEYAARGMKESTKYYWGEDLKPDGKYVANIYQGNFPTHDAKEDGFAGLAPVRSFGANPLGLYDMEGNVWEWCSDFYRSDYYQNSPKKNPRGPADSFDPQESGLVKRVQRGGSFLCNDQHYERYASGARGMGEISSASNNAGFRCVGDALQF